MTKILLFDEIGGIEDLWQNFSRNLHFLRNEKWHFWRQNPLEPTYDVKHAQTQQYVTDTETKQRDYDISYRYVEQIL